jgi:hypothetical protein|tara:strand:- start:33 stop:491 length:459 start_codon:yes stop_codon:yes gene_type:complete
MVRIALLLIFLVGFVGCSVRQPIATYKEASVTQSTPEAIAFEVEFEIVNTNNIPLQLLMYNYRVTSNGEVVFVGFESAEKTIPRSSSIVDSLQVVIPREYVLGKDSCSWQLSGTLGYIPPKAISETLLDIGLWEPKTSVRGHGLVQVPDITD